MGKMFKHNEKTDFIVNMTHKGFQKLAFVFLTAASAGVALSLLPYYLKRGSEYISGGSEIIIGSVLSNMDALEMLKYAPVVLMAFGFFGFLMLIIAGLKKYFVPKENKTILLAAGFLLMCAVSAAVSVNFRTAFFGSDGRYEGLISVIAYMGLFSAGLCLTDKKKRQIIADVIIVIAGVQAVLGILQTIPPTNELIPSFFGEKIVDESEFFAANGFTGSPYTMAALAVMGLGLAVNGAMHHDSPKKRILYTVASAVLSVGGFMTKNLAAVIGIIAVLAASAVIEVVRLKTGHGLLVKGFLKNPLGIWALCAAIAAAAFVALKLAGIFAFEDAYIVLTDSYNRTLQSMPIYENIKGIGIYPKVWKEVFEVLKNNWAFGTGFDCIALSLYEDPSIVAGSADRAYNEYLNLAASAGAVSLIFYLGFVVAVLKRGISRTARFFNKTDSWVSAAALTACIGYLAQAVCGVTAMSSTPFFFILMGLCFSRNKESE